MKKTLNLRTYFVRVRTEVAAALAHRRDRAYQVAAAREPEDDQHPARLRGEATQPFEQLGHGRATTVTFDASTLKPPIPAGPVPGTVPVPGQRRFGARQSG